MDESSLAVMQTAVHLIVALNYNFSIENLNAKVGLLQERRSRGRPGALIMNSRLAYVYPAPSTGSTSIPTQVLALPPATDYAH
jgi:hypothetical protein